MRYQQFSRQRLLRIVAVTIVISLLGTSNLQAIEPEDMVGQEVFTLTNLHPDEQNRRLYSTNYQQPGRIKVCTKVRIDKLKRKKMWFTIVESNREYQYYLHRKSTPEGFDENIKKYFGPECPQAEIDAMSEVDQKGIKKMRARVGMTRRGVIIAMGYPPEHVTYDLEYEEWVYWVNKFARDAVIFGEDGKVSEYRD